MRERRSGAQSRTTTLWALHIALRESPARSRVSFRFAALARDTRPQPGPGPCYWPAPTLSHGLVAHACLTASSISGGGPIFTLTTIGLPVSSTLLRLDRMNGQP